MTQQPVQKDEFTTTLRQQIIAAVPQAQETDRADDSLCTISFQSKTHPERHAWIDTSDAVLRIDLENWQDETEWDNSTARITIESAEEAIELLDDWFVGSDLRNYSNLNKNYGIVKKKLVII